MGSMRLNQAQNEFFAISLSLDHEFSLQLHTVRGYNNM